MGSPRKRRRLRTRLEACSPPRRCRLCRGEIPGILLGGQMAP